MSGVCFLNIADIHFVRYIRVYEFLHQGPLFQSKKKKDELVVFPVFRILLPDTLMSMKTQLIDHKFSDFYL